MSEEDQVAYLVGDGGDSLYPAELAALETLRSALSDEASWVEAQSDGQAVFGQTLYRGESRTFKGTDSVAIFVAREISERRFAIERDLWVFSDEVYADYTYAFEATSLARLPGAASSSMPPPPSPAAAPVPLSPSSAPTRRCRTRWPAPRRRICAS